MGVYVTCFNAILIAMFYFVSQAVLVSNLKKQVIHSNIQWHRTIKITLLLWNLNDIVDIILGINIINGSYPMDTVYAPITDQIRSR